MIVVGFVLLVGAVVVAIALIVQNPGMVTVHAFSWSRDVEMRWLIVAGLALTAIGLLGLATMRVGAARYARLRRDRKALAVENKRLTREARTAEVPAVATRPGSDVYTAPHGASASPGSFASTATGQRAGVGRSSPGPAAPSTGAVAASDRPAGTSTEPHGIRERLAATRHRRSKG